MKSEGGFSMWIKKNWLMGRFLRLNRIVCVLCIAFSFVFLVVLLVWAIWHFLLSGRYLFLGPWYELLLFGIALWGAAAFAFHGLVSLGKMMPPSGKNFAGNLWSIITFVAMIVAVGAFCLICAISNSFVAGDISSRAEKGLVLCGSPADKSSTIYFYKTSGNMLSGMDVEVTLEMTEEPGKEYPVCRLSGVSSLGLTWSGNNTFLVNDQAYSVRRVQAAGEPQNP